ncbi:MAG: hypothetical protein J5912_00885 [Clostridia bacterium]|nr:hypothetical protein [Clostridia bacterium]
MASRSRDEHAERMKERAEAGRKPDKRTQDSLKKIRNAYAEMLGEGYNPATVSVSMLAERANIDRKTFYNYYDGIYALENAIVSEIGEMFRETFCRNPMPERGNLPHVFFKALAEVLNEDIDFYGAMFKLGSGSALGRAVREIVKEETSKIVKSRHKATKELEIALDFIIAGSLEVYRQWYELDPRPPLASYSAIISEMCYSGIYSVLDREVK